MRKKLGAIGGDQKGFTIIELMIASLVFSVILLIATFAIVQISRTYIKGYIGSETQNTARAIEDQISQAIQDSNASTITINNPNPGHFPKYYWFCINGERYTYQYNYSLGVTGPQDVFLEDPDQTQDLAPNACGEAANLASPPANSKELVSYNMQIIQPTGGGGILVGNPPLYTIDMNLLYGSPGSYTLAFGNYTCNSLSAGGEFCSLSSGTTTVEQRTDVP